MIAHGPQQQRLLRRAMLGTVVVAAFALFLLTPTLIAPWPDRAPWFESPGFFPRVALAMAGLAAVAALTARRRPRANGRRGSADGAGDGAEDQADIADEASDDIDASESNPRLVLACLVAFGAHILLVPLIGFGPSTALFTAGVSLLSGLGLRMALTLAAGCGIAFWLVFERLLELSFN